MGTYLIPDIGLNELSQAIDHVRQQGALTEQQVWDHGVEGGTLFTDPDRDDAACAALYSGFAVNTDWRPAMHAAIRAHAGHLKSFRDAMRNGSQVTKTMAVRAEQMEHVLADVIDWIRLTEDRL